MGFSRSYFSKGKSTSNAVWRRFFYVLLLLSILTIKTYKTVVSAELDEDAHDGNFTEPPLDVPNTSTISAPLPKEGSIAEIIDRVLEKEFSENEQDKGARRNVGSSFNNSVSEEKAVLETVARVTHDKPRRNDTQERNGTSKPFQIQDVFRVDNDDGAEELPTLIDQKDNIFIMSSRKSKYPVLELDSRFISDLVVVIISATVGGMIFSCLGQPVMTGYLLAGSFIGPWGFSFVSERVQVDTVAQFGVVFLLFALGLEFSVSKLRIVRAVAIFGGLLQILLFMGLSGLIALLCGAKPTEGIFVGAFVSMSSTAVVLKFLSDRNSLHAIYAQVTVGTLIVQDCCVGLLFSLIPVLGGNSGVFQGFMSITRSLLTLFAFLMIAMLVAHSFVPCFFALITRLSPQISFPIKNLNKHGTTVEWQLKTKLEPGLTNELYELVAVAFCLAVAWLSDMLGLSLELGSFVAGVMISTTDFAAHTLEQVEPVRNMFAALFLASIGMLIDVQFLWSHIDILVASVIIVIITKTVLVAFVVRAFGYTTKTSFLVGVSLAHVGEFAFLLLSRAHNLHLIEKRLYLLLLGTTALSLVTTPFLFRFMPVFVQFGILRRWFSMEPSQLGVTVKVL